MSATIAANVPALEQMVIDITQEIHVRSSLTATFAALLDDMGPLNQGHEGAPMPMKLEAWPGGRWYRDLGDNNGHLWGCLLYTSPSPRDS